MADDLIAAQSPLLIAGRYAVDTAQTLLEAGGGLPAYLARDRQAADGKRVAVAVSRDASPRLWAMQVLTDPIDNLMTPLGHGVAPLAGGKGEGYFVICTPPPGPPVSAPLNVWPEKALADLVLRPVAQVLDGLQSRRLTHRAIRPNNVFQSARGQPVTLGAAWAAPPAMHQPAVFESPYSAMCHPSGRGEGSIADDVYALGVLLLTLRTGAVPMANMDDGACIRWKLDLGSFAALTRNSPISGWLGDLLRGMLADDPDHRPLPAQLLDPAVLRGRRLAARPARRSQHALALNDMAVFDARMLGFALLSDHKKAVQFLRNGLVAQWLRRDLGDAGLAAQIEDLVRGRNADTRSGPLSDALLVMHTISTIGPRMPLCWRGIAVWPDGLASLLAQGMAARTDLLSAAEELLTHDIASSWVPDVTGSARPESHEMATPRFQAGDPNGLLSLFYGLNPVLPCRAAGMGDAWVADIPALMRFFEGVAGSAGEHLIDPPLAAFITAHGDRRIEIQVRTLLGSKTVELFRAGELVLLRDLQARYYPYPMPALAKWVAGRLRPAVERWRNKPRREAMQVRLDGLAQAGSVSRLLDLTDDTAARALDVAGAIRAANELAAIDAEVAGIDNADRQRFADAERFGQAIAGGIGLSVFILVVMSVLF